jgi:hypothetical protein
MPTTGSCQNGAISSFLAIFFENHQYPQINNDHFCESPPDPIEIEHKIWADNQTSNHEATNILNIHKY